MADAPLDLRDWMRSVVSPVVVVTAVEGVEPRGITIGSFVSVSLDPPLVCFNVMHSSRMHPVLLAAERFAVSVLAETQVEISSRFARPGLTGIQQFEGLSTHRDASGIPVIEGALGWMTCRIQAVYEGGDHSIFLGLVETLEAGEDAGPLLYFGGDYRGIGPRIR